MPVEKDSSGAGRFSSMTHQMTRRGLDHVPENPIILLSCDLFKLVLPFFYKYEISSLLEIKQIVT